MPENDRPDATSTLIGHEDAERALLNAYRGGRTHHAWLLEGPAGIGKATLAFRFARFVLRNPDPAGAVVRNASDLAVDPEEPVFRQVRARANPNLLVLEIPRDAEGKQTATVITVDAIRGVGRFLSTTAAAAGWRLVLVDSADDLNRSAANALLKLLEEPPARCIFILVSHVPGRLLPTVRSRCRRLALRPLNEDAVLAALETAGTGSQDDRRLAAQLSGGSLGRAFQIASGAGADVARAVLGLLDTAPRGDPVAVQALAAKLGRRTGGDAAWRLATTLILEWIASSARAQAGAGAPARHLAPWGEVWDNVRRVIDEAEIYNLDRTQALMSIFAAVSAAPAADAARA